MVVVTEGDGPAAARNAGADDATGDVVVFVDADVLPHADAFTRIRAAVRRGSGRWLRSSARTTTCRPTQASSRSFGTSCTTTSTSRAPVTRRRSGPGSGRYARTRFAPRAGSTPSATRSLPSRTSTSGRGSSRDGGRILLDPLIQGTHLKRWTLSDMVRTDFWQRGVPWVELVLRHGSGSTALNLGWRHRVSAAAAVDLGARAPAREAGDGAGRARRARRAQRRALRALAPPARAGRRCHGRWPARRAPRDRSARGARRRGQASPSTARCANPLPDHRARSR